MPYLVTVPITIGVSSVVSDQLGTLLATVYPANLVKLPSTASSTASGTAAPAGGTYFSIQQTPAGTPNGTPLFAGGVPAGADGACLILQPAQTISVYVASAQPTSQPPAIDVLTYTNSSSNPMVVRDVLTGLEDVYIIAGACEFIAGSAAVIASFAAGQGVSGGGGSTSLSGPISLAPIGVGVEFLVTAGTPAAPAVLAAAPGAPMPAGTTGMQFYVPGGSSVSYVRALSQADAIARAANPQLVITFANPAGAMTEVQPENFAAGVQLYIVGTTGSPLAAFL